MTMNPTWRLRARFAQRLSDLYGEEVPAYNTLVKVSQAVNEKTIAENHVDAERFGSISRVTAERHGAIRVGSAMELRQVSRVFAALGMYPTGYYDLRDAKPAPIPVVSTAFRPLDREQLGLLKVWLTPDL
ncbi:2-oxoadipate dioxygenase/decarboxylase family protein [Arthrobacter flavus]|uniref:2-oxoadipate dioxygenase/decarboxylase n=1 Tax=Arthrobacter flavus TaxID=95172 RepID=A0ABW4QA55_9MICC